MDLSGLTSVTTKTEMLTWLAASLITPVSPAISGSDLGVIMQKLLDLSGENDAELVLFNSREGDYTLALTDQAIDMNLTNANTITIPDNADVAFPIGSQIIITQSGTGQTTVVPGSTVTINAPDGFLSLRTQYSGARLIKRDTDLWWLNGDLVATPIPVATIARINLTNNGNEATSSGWNNNLYFSSIGTQLALVTTGGASSGWSITAAVGTPGTGIFEHIGNISFGNADFPDDVLSTLWYIENGTNFSFVISGLDPEKVYTVKTCAADSGTGDGPSKVTVGGVSQLGGSPENVAIELIFDGVTSDSEGNLAITVDNSAGAAYPLLNAMIISENLSRGN